ncbi:MAG: hypothetical protein M1833_006642 [Piccolia ochrophora]|nr:MAG: hypothetical protein M1833_006642 [Piccolia ochrophora]
MLCFPMPPTPLSFNAHHGPTSSSSSGAATSSSPSSNPTPPAKRPKLSLQISVPDAPRAFGKSTTNLTLSTPSGSPTVRNTYNNAYEPVVATATPAPPRVASSPLSATTTRSPAYRRSSLFADPASDVPYQQPMGVRSILRNSPLPRLRPRSTTSTRAPRVLFPRQKRVVYSSPMSEDITTTRFTFTHMELLQEDDERDEAEWRTQLEARRGDTPPPPPRDEASDESDESTTNSERLATPKRGRRQKRNWTWTLSPIDETKLGTKSEGLKLDADGHGGDDVNDDAHDECE